MDFKEGDKVVIKTHYTNGDKARTNYPYTSREVKRMQVDPMTIVSVSEAPDSVYIDCETYLGRKMIQPHGHMWFLESDLNIAK